MKDQRKSKAQLIVEIESLRQRLDGLEGMNPSARVEEALKEREEKFKEMIEKLPGSVYQLRISPEGKISFPYMNGRTREALGLSDGEIQEAPLRMREAVFPEDREKLMESIQSSMASLLPPDLEFRIKTPVGTRWVRNQYTGFREADGGTIWTCISTDITDRKQAEQALRESEKKYRVLIENANEAIFVVQDGRFKFGNPKSLTFTGYSVEELTSRFFTQFIHPDDRDMVIDRHLRRLKGEKFTNVYSFRFMNKSGELKWVEISAVMITWEGRPATLNFLSDITDRKQAEQALHRLTLELEERVQRRTAELEREVLDRKAAEEALRESEEKYRMLYEYAGEAIYTYAPDLKMIDINKIACTFVGRSREEMIGKNIFDLGLLHPEDVGKASEDIKKLLERGEIVTDQLRIQVKGGHYAVFEIIGAPLKKDGRVVAITCLCQDITERKRAEEEIRKSQGMLQIAFDGVSDPMVMIDKDFSVRMVNNAAKNYYNIHDPREIIGGPCYRILKGNPEPCENCNVALAISRGEAFQFERNSPMDPERIEQVTIFPVKERDKRVEFIIIRKNDITETKYLERQLMQNEKLASLGLLVSGIAHEINNPNNFIEFNMPILRDYLQELMPVVDNYAQGQRDYELSGMPYREFREDLFKLLDNIEHGARRITSVISNLQEFGGRKDRIEKRWVDLKTVIDKSITLSQGQVKKKVGSLEINLPPGLPQIFTDPEAMEQVLINLLINAAQAADKKDSWIRLNVIPGNTWRDSWALEVRDNGCGMEEKVRKKIFTPFFTTKPPGAGTGLGLYICHTLIEGLGGRIEVESEPGSGSTFRVILPGRDRRAERRIIKLDEGLIGTSPRG